MEYESHPAAELFPMMSAAELDILAEDIKTNGLFEPILLYEGKILDGRNRQAACKLVAVSPRYEGADVNGQSPLAVVVSKNLHRRHLTGSQRAAIGAKLVPLLREEAQKRKIHAGEYGVEGGRGHKKTLGSVLNQGFSRNPRSTQIAAQAVGVGATTVSYAATVMERDPKLFQSIECGEITACKAYDKVMGTNVSKSPTPEKCPARPKKHSRLPAVGTKKREQWEAAAARRMMVGLSEVRGHARGLSEMDERLFSTLSKQERREWSAIIQEIVKNLRDFSRKLERNDNGNSTGKDQDQAREAPCAQPADSSHRAAGACALEAQAV